MPGQAQLQEICDLQGIGYGFSKTTKAPAFHLDLNLGIRLDVAKPIRIHASSCTHIEITIQLIILQRSNARFTRLASGGGEQQDKPSLETSQPKPIKDPGGQLEQFPHEPGDLFHPVASIRHAAASFSYAYHL
jgi:hypothetical protein